VHREQTEHVKKGKVQPPYQLSSRRGGRPRRDRRSGTERRGKKNSDLRKAKTLKKTDIKEVCCSREGSSYDWGRKDKKAKLTEGEGARR